MQKDSLPLYYKNWFLITLFLIGPATFYITSIAAIVLMLSKDKALLTVTKEEHAKYQEILAQQHEADSIVINAKSDAKQIINDAKKDAENIITEANNKKEKINDEVLTLEKEKERFDLILSEHADEVLFKETMIGATINPVGAVVGAVAGGARKKKGKVDTTSITTTEEKPGKAILNLRNVASGEIKTVKAKLTQAEANNVQMFFLS